MERGFIWVNRVLAGLADINILLADIISAGSYLNRKFEEKAFQREKNKKTDPNLHPKLIFSKISEKIPLWTEFFHCF